MPLIIEEKMLSMSSVQSLREEGTVMQPVSSCAQVPKNTIKILIVNLMPKKIETEEQLLRILGAIPLNIQVGFLYMKTHKTKTTSLEYLQTYYKSLGDIIKEKYHGMIITGAPVEHLEFEEVDYWEELKEIFKYARTNVCSTLNICWAAQAALYNYYGIKKYGIEKKVFGVFKHSINNRKHRLFSSFDDEFYVPHSRHTEVKKEDIEKMPGLEVLSESPDSGVYIAAERGGRNFFVTGHSEYSSHTLKNEYERDRNKGLEIEMPKNYFLENDPGKKPVVAWRAHAYLLFSNWVSHYLKNMLQE